MSKAHQTIFRLTLPSTPRAVARVETFLHKVNRSVHLDEIQFHKLIVSLTEAVNNAIVHGNKQNPHKKVTVKCEVLPGWIVVLVNDSGRGFRPDRLKSPLRRRNLLQVNGRGIFLMRTLMDKVEFEMRRSGTEVRLWLDLNK